MMYKKLPFELRNVVYSYLCLEDRHIPIGPYYHFRKHESPNNDNRNSRNRDATNPLKESDIDSDLAKYGDREHAIEEDEEVRKDAQTVLPDGRIRTDHDVYPPSDYVMPKDVIFKSSYMGEKVALEALKFYYANNNFSICNVDGGLKLLFKQELLQPAHDALLVGFAPIDHVRNLQIRVKCEHFTVLTELPSAPTELRLNQFIEEEHFLRRTVESLTDFRRRILTSPSRELNIEIVLMSDLTSASATGDTNFRAAEWMHYRITNFLQTIRNCVYELIHDRDQTTVQVIHQDDGLMAFPKNYTGLFQLTKNQWDYVRTPLTHRHLMRHNVNTPYRRSLNSNPTTTGRTISGSFPSSPTKPVQNSCQCTAATSARNTKTSSVSDGALATYYGRRLVRQRLWKACIGLSVRRFVVTQRHNTNLSCKTAYVVSWIMRLALLLASILESVVTKIDGNAKSLQR